MKKLFVLFLIVVFFLSCTQTETTHEQENQNDIRPIVECECNEMPTGKIVWNYPKLSQEERIWYTQSKEMVEAWQIPEDVLSSLSTEDLTLICLNYPFRDHVNSYETLEEGYERLYNNFNGIRKLFEKEEAYKELLKYYNYHLTNDWVDIETGMQKWYGFYFYQWYTLSFLEILLSNFVSQDVDAVEKYREILKCLFFGYKKTLLQIDAFNISFVHIDTYNLYARAQLIVKICESCIEEFPDGINSRLFGGIRNQQLKDVVNRLSYQLIK